MVKLGHCKSVFLKKHKRCSPGINHGTTTFNIFLNDIFYFVKKFKPIQPCRWHTLSYSHHDLLEAKNILTSESEYVIEWFGTNQMKADHGTFKAIVLSKRGHGDCESFT